MSEIYILGSKINDLSLAEAVEKIKAQLLTDQKAYIVTPNPEICLISYQDKEFRRIIQNSFLAIPDGFGLKIGARILGSRIKNLTTGIDLCCKLLELSEQQSYSILFLGGKQETGDRVKILLKQKYPNLKIEYINGSQFDKQGNSTQSNLINLINSVNPDITFVCLGAPKQEYFMANNQTKLETKLMLGLGGTIDFLSGEVKRAPVNFRKLGLEWLWRLLKEPWRWQRIIKAVIIFPLACLRWRFGNLFIYRKNVAGFIINKNKQILIAKHSKYGEWKLPQGGSKNAETKEELEKSIIREIKEELSTDKFKIIKMLKNCFKYKWPKDNYYINIDKFKGQKQTLFLLEFIGQDSDIKLDLHEHTEWQWVDKNKILEIAAPKRRKLIQIGLENFKDYL